MIVISTLIEWGPLVLAFSLIATLLYMIISSLIGNADIYTPISWSLILLGWLLLMFLHWEKKVAGENISIELQFSIYVTIATILIVSTYMLIIAEGT